MAKFDQELAAKAVRDSIAETVRRMGIDAVRKLSWFPSSRKAQEKKAA